MLTEMQKIKNPVFWAQCPEGFKLRVKHVKTYWDASMGGWASVYSHFEPDALLEGREVTYLTFSKPDEGQLKIILEIAVINFWLMTEPQSHKWPIGRA